jgi:acyl carrier protein
MKLTEALKENQVLNENSLPDRRDHVSDSLVLRTSIPLLGPYVAPRTATEQTLVAIWCEALDMDQVGVVDTYDDLGGDSIAAAIIFARIEKAFSLDISTEMLADASTVEQLAREIDALKNR